LMVANPVVADAVERHIAGLISDGHLQALPLSH
jgi:hypothetical protein